MPALRAVHRVLHAQRVSPPRQPLPGGCGPVAAGCPPHDAHRALPALCVNYYEHHLGDYAEATGHLSFVEDAAYSRLMRKAYATEKPLPADTKAVQRLIGARTKEERQAVEAVLAEFWTLTADGWRNARCDAEIARYQDKQRKAKASAEARWSHTGRNANAPPDAMRTHSEGNALQTPDTRHQTPEEKKAPRAARTASPKKSAIPDDFTVSDRVRDWAASNGHGQLTRHLEHFRSACKAKGYTYVDWDEAFMNCIREDWGKVRATGPTNGKHDARAKVGGEIWKGTNDERPAERVIDGEAKRVA